MYSSRMRTTRSLTVCHSCSIGWGHACHAPSHACPPATHAPPQPCMPPATHPPATHALPAMHASLPSHTCPPHNHAPPFNHTCPPGNHACPPVDRQTPVKTQPSQTSFAGGNDRNLCYIYMHENSVLFCAYREKLEWMLSKEATYIMASNYPH